LLGAARQVSCWSVDALFRDDPLLAVAFGSALSDALKISVEIALHANAGGPRGALVSTSGVDTTKRRGHHSVLASLAAACRIAKLRARWHRVHGSWGRGLLDLNRLVHSWQSLATFVDHSVALDENLGSDISSVSDLAGTSGSINLASTMVVDLHATLNAILVESTSGIAHAACE